MKTVRDLGEFGLIRVLQAVAEKRSGGPAARTSVVVGIGDDCAVLRGANPQTRLLYTCDPVVEGVHYRPSAPPRQVGWKAMARNLSDIAAMGGRPRWAVVSLGLRATTRVDYVRQLYAGINAAAARFDCRVVGGDVTHVPHEPFVVIALIGEVEKSRLTLRSGARPGDVVLVTGRLGGSLRGKHLTFTPRVAEARWLVEHFPVHAMIDISDGLSGDLQRLVEAGRGRIGFEIDAAKIPLAPSARGRLDAAFHDGEDFELLFTMAPRPAAALRARWPRRFRVPVTAIGRVVRGPGPIVLVDARGIKRPLPPRGYDHFAND